MGKGDTPRPVDKVAYDNNFDAINWGPEKTRIVDEHNNPTKLSSRQKNVIYKKAKELKGELREALCTKTECFKPTEVNVRKMINSEMRVKHKVQLFKNSMKAIDADPRDFNVERIRKGR